MLRHGKEDVRVTMRSKKALKPWQRALIAGSIAGLLLLLSLGSFFFVGFGFINKTNTEKAGLESKLTTLQKEIKTLKTLQIKEELALIKQVQVANDLPEQTIISADVLNIVEVQKPDANPNVLTDTALAIGKVTLKPITAGSLLKRTDIQDPRGTFYLKPGERALTIAVEEAGALAGKLEIGTYVDVLVNINPDGQAPLTRTLLQRVKVIGTDSNKEEQTNTSYRSTSPSKQLVTLAVSPRQAETLALGNQHGRFHLALRSFNDTALANAPGQTLNHLIHGGSGLPPTIGYRMEIVKGGTPSVVTLEGSGS